MTYHRRRQAKPDPALNKMALKEVGIFWLIMGGLAAYIYGIVELTFRYNSPAPIGIGLGVPAAIVFSILVYETSPAHRQKVQVKK